MVILTLAAAHWDQTLDGGEVLPGFTLSIREWIGKAERTAPKKGRTKG
jgi:hypothetical protein